MNSDAFERFNHFLDSPCPPSLDATPRAGRKALAGLEADLGRALREARLDAGAEALIRALVLLWHDYLDEAHTLSQAIETADGSFLHGIVHRREPDYWNAKYWFNRVGRHATLGEIGRQAGLVLSYRDEPALKKQLLPEGLWNPNAFVDACERAMKTKSASIQTLQALQEIESRVLLKHFCARSS